MVGFTTKFTHPNLLFCCSDDPFRPTLRLEWCHRTTLFTKTTEICSRTQTTTEKLKSMGGEDEHAQLLKFCCQLVLNLNLQIQTINFKCEFFPSISILLNFSRMIASQKRISPGEIWQYSPSLLMKTRLNCLCNSK